MNALEHQLDYVFADTLPQPGEVVEVAPGILWVRMPLPFALDHMDVWLLRDRFDGVEGWAVVDCGIISSETTRANWERRVRKRAGRFAGAAGHRHALPSGSPGPG